MFFQNSGGHFGPNFDLETDVSGLVPPVVNAAVPETPLEQRGVIRSRDESDTPSDAPPHGWRCLPESTSNSDDGPLGGAAHTIAGAKVEMEANGVCNITCRRDSPST